ncbi:MAG TPA: 30S ribosome-binding factor RbfA [Burkholderiaceae bacterium]|nr:30S ribosome-binding factor RbfA [Burkholderiaceae bacterium]
MNDRRLQRLQEQIKARVAEILQRDLQDPKLGIVTVSRVELDREFTQCTVYWSALGSDKEQRRTQAALQRARSFVQRAVGVTLHTRTVPRLLFVFDPSIAGAIKMEGLLKELQRERQARTGEAPAPEGPPPDVQPDVPPDWPPDRPRP